MILKKNDFAYFVVLLSFFLSFFLIIHGEYATSILKRKCCFHVR